ncbi:hypothetical protein I5907_16255 [Panacibacter sp. DH6]|uniref:Uncharacterized protein n=1 Tax=Panacibacter microcysteis TaxID=2793269 RepID=A0A931E9T0_9BACT|nr:hypothetical protein [Panacibacter microcysteis]MBG9377794.1 hypothetical protein [Panacibacter microcysteis]
MEVSVSFNGMQYAIAPGDDGWLYVTGADIFRFTRDDKYFWHFSKQIDNDLQVVLKLKAFVTGLYKH